MAIQYSLAEQQGLQRETKISWEQFNFWFNGFEHSFKNSLSGPNTDQLNEIRRQLGRVRGSDFYGENTSNSPGHIGGRVVENPYYTGVQ